MVYNFWGLNSKKKRCRYKISRNKPKKKPNQNIKCLKIWGANECVYQFEFRVSWLEREGHEWRKEEWRKEIKLGCEFQNEIVLRTWPVFS
jgi:hypothetical protein